MVAVAETILTNLQRRCLDWVAQEPNLVERFYLSGGTALAEFYLHHRLSEDLDFFSEEEFDSVELEPYIQKLKRHLGAQSIRLENRLNRNLIYFETDKEALKVEFSWFIGSPIDPGRRYFELRIDSERDLAVNKLFTLYQRPRARDYVDLFFLMKEYHYQLRDLVKLAKIKFDWHIDPIQLGSRFISLDLTDWPTLIRPLTENDLRQYFQKLARQLEGDVFGS